MVFRRIRSPIRTPLFCIHSIQSWSRPTCSNGIFRLSVSYRLTACSKSPMPGRKGTNCLCSSTATRLRLHPIPPRTSPHAGPCRSSTMGLTGSARSARRVTTRCRCITRSGSGTGCSFKPPTPGHIPSTTLPMRTSAPRRTIATFAISGIRKRSTGTPTSACGTGSSPATSTNYR